jgi:transaldolase
MKFFVVSADPSEIRACALQAIIEGVSVGASTAAADRAALVREICAVFGGPVSVPVGDGGGEAPEGRWRKSDGSEALESRLGLLEEARTLATIASNVVAELPFSESGLGVVRACAAEGIKTHVARCLTPVQALRAAQAGASYASPSGRPEDAADFDLVRKIVASYKTYGIATEVLVVAVRSAGDVLDAALAGAQIASVPFPFLQQIIGQRR